MLKDFFHKLCDFLKRVLSSRIFALALVFTGMFLVLAAKLFDLQIINGESYLEDYVQMIEKTVTTPGTRGNIYDRNGKLLAYNELAYAVTVQDTGDYPKSAGMNGMLLKLVQILNKHGYQAQGKLEFTHPRPRRPENDFCVIFTDAGPWMSSTMKRENTRPR